MARANNTTEWQNTRQLGRRYDALVSARHGSTECASRRGGGRGAGPRGRPPQQLRAALCVGLIDRARPQRAVELCHVLPLSLYRNSIPAGYSSTHISQKPVRWYVAALLATTTTSSKCWPWRGGDSTSMLSFGLVGTNQYKLYSTKIWQKKILQISGEDYNFSNNATT